MKTVLRKTLQTALALFLTSQLLPGLKIQDGLINYLIGGFVLSILYFVVRPIIHIVTLPLQFVTLGLFSFLTNAIILYLLTVFYPSISVESFKFAGFRYAGFVIPAMSFNGLFAFIAVAFALTSVLSFINWLHK
jgi:putative membrane protein